MIKPPERVLILRHGNIAAGLPLQIGVAAGIYFPDGGKIPAAKGGLKKHVGSY